MGVLGSGLTGLGNVATAGEPPGGVAGGGTTGGESSVVGKFSAVSGDVAVPTTTYMADDGTVAGGSASFFGYATSARTITHLRLTAPVGTGAHPPTATLYKNNVATAMTCTLPAGAAAGANVVDSAHAITFVDGDTFAVVLTQPIAAEGSAPFTATLEGPASSAEFPGFGGAPPAVAAASSAGTSGLAAQSDHTHAQSFGGTGLAVGISGAGAATTAARGDHGHATLTAATSALLTAMDVTAIADGTPCYLTSRDAIFRIITSARATNTWDTLASATAGRVWLRDARISLKNCSVTAWTVNTTTGDDDAVGTGANPLKTMSELAWRLSNGWLPASVTATITGSMVATDLPLFTFRIQSTFTFTVTFTPVVIYTSAGGVTALTTPAAGPNTQESTFVDAAVPGGSFTAAGAMANGVIGTRTNGTAAYFWFALDKGATTVRTSKPSAALANADTYTASTLPTAQVMRFAETRTNACVIQLCKITGGAWPDSPRFDRCWFTSACTALPSARYSNCAFETGAVITNAAVNVTETVFSTAGMVRGNGTANLTIQGCTGVAFTGTMTLQGAAIVLSTSSTAVVSVDQWVYDFTQAAAGAFRAIYWSFWTWITGAIVGSGNTTILFLADYESHIAINKPGGGFVVAGISTNPTPVTALGTAPFALVGGGVASLDTGAGVVNRSGNGVFYTNLAADAPLISGTAVANGAVAIGVTNVAPAGTAATIQRWVDIPDGAGGTFRVPSFL